MLCRAASAPDDDPSTYDVFASTLKWRDDSLSDYCPLLLFLALPAQEKFGKKLANEGMSRAGRRAD